MFHLGEIFGLLLVFFVEEMFSRFSHYKIVCLDYFLFTFTLSCVVYILAFV